MKLTWLGVRLPVLRVPRCFEGGVTQLYVRPPFISIGGVSKIMELQLWLIIVDLVRQNCLNIFRLLPLYNQVKIVTKYPKYPPLPGTPQSLQAGG